MTAIPPTDSGIETGEIALIQQAAGGDDTAYTELFERHFDSVYNYAHWLSNDSALAEDLTQEAFIQMHRRLSEFGPPWKLRAWLYRLVRNRFVDLGRRERPSAPLPERARLAVDKPGPERQVLSQEVMGEVQRTLQMLPAIHREALVLREMAEMSYNEIAAIMEISLDYVKVVLHRARQSFREHYGLLLLAEDRLPDCDVLNELLDGFHDGQGIRGERLIRQHLRECATCQQRRRELVALSTLLSALPLIPSNPRFKSRLHKRVTGQQPTPPRIRTWLAIGVPLLLALMVGGGLLLANLLNEPPRDGSGTPQNGEGPVQGRPPVTPSPTPFALGTQNSTLLTMTPSPLPPPILNDEEGIVTIVEPVWYCVYLQGNEFQWYEVAIDYDAAGVPLSETVVSGPYTGPWQPNCPAGDEGGSTGGQNGDGGSGGAPQGPVCKVTADCKPGCKCVNNTCKCGG